VLVDLDHVGRLDPDQHELRDPLAARDGERLLTVGVEQQHANLAPIPGVDQPGGVHERDPVPGREPRARQHQPGLSHGNLDGDTRTDRGALSRPEHRLFDRVQVEAGVVRISARRQQRVFLEPPDVQALSTGGHASGRLSANSW
jgi:hypothetical protein